MITTNEVDLQTEIFRMASLGWILEKIGRRFRRYFNVEKPQLKRIVIDPTYYDESPSGYMETDFSTSYPPTGRYWYDDSFYHYVGQTESHTSNYKLYVSGAGSLTQWDSQYPASGSHYDKVDETTKDDDTTYIYTATEGDQDLFAIGNTGFNYDVYYVAVTAYCKKVGGGTNPAVKALCKTHGTIYKGSRSIVSSSTAYTAEAKIWYDNPDTGNAWTQQEINDLEAGVELELIEGADNVRCTQVLVQVNYKKYKQYRGFVNFDTSSIPDDATITEAVLKLALEYNASLTDFDMHFYSGKDVWNGAGDPTWDCCSTDEGVFFNTAGKSINTFYEHSVLVSSVNKTGKTQFRLKSDREGTNPTQDEYVRIYSYGDATYKPQLVITYTVPSLAKPVGDGLTFAI